MEESFRRIRLAQLDQNLPGTRTISPRPAGGWIASVREALGISLDQLGKRLKVSRQAVQRWQKDEAADRLTLRNLRRLADAMDCNLVYTFVPKSGTFTELAERPQREAAAKDVESVVHTMALEDQAPGNKQQLIEDEVQRRLSKKKRTR